MTVSTPAESVAVRPSGPAERVDAAELIRLLHASRPEEQDDAWDTFVARYSKLLLHIAGLVMPDHDGVMDGYAYVLEQLRHDDFRTLRTYVSTDKCQFSTWLAVVARRSCVDFYRQRYGRSRAGDNSVQVAERATRQRLMNLVGVTADLSQIADRNGNGPDRELRQTQLHQALQACLDDLPASDKLLLKLRYEDDLAAQAIAPIVGLPSPFHVYRRIKALCAQLRARLKDRGVEESAP